MRNAWLFVAALAASSIVHAAVPRAADVLAVMERVADWQLANPAEHPPTDWTQAAGYTGIMALSRVSPSPRFEQAMLKMADPMWMRCVLASE